jgi:hypothetical protein
MVLTAETLLDKSEVMESFKNLPEKVSAEDLIERILFVKRLKVGLQELSEGNTTPYEEVMSEARRELQIKP